MKPLFALFAVTLICSSAFAADQSAIPLKYQVTATASAMPDTLVLTAQLRTADATPEKALEKMQQLETEFLNTLKYQGIESSQVKMDYFLSSNSSSGDGWRSGFGGTQGQSSASQTAPAAGQSTVENQMIPLQQPFSLWRYYRATIPIKGKPIDKEIQKVSVLWQQVSKLSAGDTKSWEPSVQMGMAFTLKDPDALVQQATQNAITRARQLAEQTVQNMGGSTRKISLATISLTDLGQVQDTNSYNISKSGPISDFSYQKILAMVKADVGFTYHP